MSNRKKWNDKLNFFDKDKNSTWVYEKFTNRKKIDAKEVGVIIWKDGLHKKVKRGNVTKDFNRCHRTYVYRGCVVRGWFDGNASFYSSGKDEPKDAGKWSVVDKAIDAWNKDGLPQGDKKHPFYVKEGSIPKKSGIKKDTTEDVMEKMQKWLESAKK